MDKMKQNELCCVILEQFVIKKKKSDTGSLISNASADEVG